MSAKFDEFKAALEALCIEHRVMLVTDGTIDVWDWAEGEPLHCGICDETKPSKS